MVCSCSLNPHERLVKKYFVEEVKKENVVVVKGFKLIDAEHSDCWHCAPRFCPDDIKSRLNGLAKHAFEAFAEVITTSIAAYHLHPFQSLQLQRTINFFLGEYLDEKGGKLSPLMRIAQTIHNLGRNATLVDKIVYQKRLISLITRIVFRQHLFDPLEYVSHGFDHSLNVAKTARLVLGDYAVRQSMEKKFGKTVDNTALVELLAYLHDCGYPHLHDRAKANHAMYSADLVDQLKTDLSKFLPEPAFKALRKAVFSHNADDKSATFDAKYCTHSGDYLLSSKETHRLIVIDFFTLEEPHLRSARAPQEEPPADPERKKYWGRKLDLFLPKDGFIGSELTPAFLENDPLGFIIRVADNLDFSFSRFNWIQSHYAFLHLCLLRHFIGVLKKKAEKAYPNESLDRLKAKAKELETLVVEHLEKYQILKLVEKGVNAESFRHFAGCQAIQKMTKFELICIENLNHYTARVHVTILTDVWKRLEGIIIEEDQRSVKAAEYQLYRTWVAFQQVFKGVEPEKLEPDGETYHYSLANELEFVLTTEQGVSHDICNFHIKEMTGTHNKIA